MIKIIFALVAIDIFLSIINLKKQNKMATKEEVKQALADLRASIDAKQEEVIAKIQELKDQIANGGTITEADLDEVVTIIKDTQTDVDTTDLDGEDEPPVEPGG